VRGRQWWIPVIAIVLGTGLAIGIDQISGGHHSGDVKLNLSQATTTTSPDEDTVTSIDDTGTSTPTETTISDLVDSSTPPASSSGSTSGTSKTTKTTKAPRTPGGGTNGTSPPNTTPNTTPGSTPDTNYCEQNPDICYPPTTHRSPSTTRTSRTTTTDFFNGDPP
jgi:hypothetical protein